MPSIQSRARCPCRRHRGNDSFAFGPGGNSRRWRRTNLTTTSAILGTRCARLPIFALSCREWLTCPSRDVVSRFIVVVSGRNSPCCHWCTEFLASRTRVNHAGSLSAVAPPLRCCRPVPVGQLLLVSESSVPFRPFGRSVQGDCLFITCRSVLSVQKHVSCTVRE